MQKQRKPIPVMYRGIVDTSKAKASQAKQTNDRNKAIAAYYFDSAPTIGNLVKGTYYWLSGNVFGDSEDPKSYQMSYGTVPDLTSVSRAKAFKIGKQMLDKIQNYRKKITKFSNKNEQNLSEKVLKEVQNHVKQTPDRVKRAYQVGLKRGEIKGNSLATQTQINAAKRAGRTEGAAIQKRWDARQATNNPSATQTPTTQEPIDSKGFWGNTRRVLWETKNNNFGKSYKWRNAARVPIYMTGTPFIIGSATEGLPQYFKYVGTAFEKGRQAAGYKPDSTSNTSAVQDSSLVIQDSTNNNSQDTIAPVLRNNNDPVTTSSKAQLDSINKEWGK